MCGYPNKNTPKLVIKKNNNELPSIVPLLIFFELIPIQDINIKDKYTNIVIKPIPKNKSDKNIHNNGKPNANHLLSNLFPPNKAIAVIGATFGGCGNNLVITANTIIDNIVIFLYS